MTIQVTKMMSKLKNISETLAIFVLIYAIGFGALMGLLILTVHLTKP